MYVGKAPSGVASRLRQHLKGKEAWSRALLVRRDTTYGFNSAQIGWLEGRLYDLFDAAENAVLNNENRPRDETLPPYDRQMLELVILPVTRVLRLVGYDPATPDEATPVPHSARSAKFFGITMEQIIEAGLIHPGAKLVSTNGAWPAVAELLANGAICFEGTEYETPSKASGAAKQGGASNGWEFWAVETPEGRVSLATLRARMLDRKSGTSAPVGQAPESRSVREDMPAVMSLPSDRDERI